MQIPFKYLKFSDVFSKKKALILLETTELNQHAIKLQESQQALYSPIYNLGPVELEMLKLTSKLILSTALFSFQNHLLVLLSSLLES